MPNVPRPAVVSSVFGDRALSASNSQVCIARSPKPCYPGMTGASKGATTSVQPPLSAGPSKDRTTSDRTASSPASSELDRKPATSLIRRRATIAHTDAKPVSSPGVSNRSRLPDQVQIAPGVQSHRQVQIVLRMPCPRRPGDAGRRGFQQTAVCYKHITGTAIHPRRPSTTGKTSYLQ